MKQLAKCIRVVNDGQVWASNEELGYVFQALAGSPLSRPLNSSGLTQLSNRERDVVRCLAEGMSNREIAQKLRISPYTVKNYVFKIFDRLGVSNRVELLFYVMSRSASSAASPLLVPPAVENSVMQASGRPQSPATAMRPAKSAAPALSDSQVASSGIGR